MSRRHAARRGSAALALAAALAADPRPSRAQAGGDAAAAEALFEQAIALMRQGDYEQACPRLAESQRLDAGVGTLLYLAACYERLGKTASAWATYREAADAARRQGQADREQQAREGAAALEARLARLLVEVPAGSAAPGLSVRRNGQELAPVLWGTAMPVDPGAYTVEASAPGRLPWSTTAAVDPAGGTATVTVPPLAAAPPPDGARPAAPAGAAAPAAQEAPRLTPRDAGGLPAQRIVALVAAGAGVVGIGVSIGLGFRARARFEEAGPHCDGDVCDDAGVDLRDDAVALARTGTVVFLVGAAGAAAGAVLWFTSPSPAATAAMRPAVQVGLGPTGLSLGGRF
ncbi:tetratricopeptide repeat protein [Sorangium sp. So ce542]|uniref:tetratricopeptide repeat protein n=1 Tax=Sorangium sp. So ce542 TaxID=3133316 RepID=UPI003F62E40A